MGATSTDDSESVRTKIKKRSRDDVCNEFYITDVYQQIQKHAILKLRNES